MRGCVLASGLLWLGACGAAQLPASQPSSARVAGDPHGPPMLSALPDLAPGETERLHRGMTLAAEVFDARMPAPPVERSYDALSAWVAQDVAAWIAARREAVEETRFQFRAGGDADVIGRAVIGLLQEDTARALSSIPSPLELDSEPEIAEMYRELVRVQSDPFLNAAMAEYQRCAAAADDSAGPNRRFARFCRARRQHLAATPPPLAAAK